MQSRRLNHARSLALALLGCALLACAFGGASRAQSGRRNPPPRTEAPVPTPTPEPPRVKPAPPPQIKVLFTSSSSVSIHLSSVDESIVANTFLQRLHDSNALDVKTADRMSHTGARKRAKEETDRFVIWLELQTNNMGMDSIGVMRPNAEDLHIEYVIIEPGTGKSKAGGSVYLRTVRSLPGGVGRPSCYPNSNYGLDAALMIGALETAERIFNNLSVPSPPLCGQ